ncbi:MAG TPA: cyanophycin synthetase [Pirellulales bacterium]
MEIRKIVVLRGPNIWAWVQVLEAVVDLQEFKDSPSDSLPGFNERLMAWLPSMIEHRCSIGERGGFFERLRRGTYQGHILEHVTIELQRLAGCDVGLGKARETPEDGVYKVVIEFEEESVGRAALDVAHRLCLAAIHNQPFDVTTEVKKLRELADDVCLGPSTRAIVSAAEARDIPVRRLNSGSLVQLGWGARQRRILTAESDRTSAIAESIAHDKDLTRQMLRTVGVPTPEGRGVSSVEDAWEAAEEIGLPVVVKPRGGNHGRGVFTNVTTREQVAAAYAFIEKEEGAVVVERFAPGVEHRVLVVNGRVVAASRGEPAVIVGDGHHNVARLIDEQLNSDPRRGEDCSSLLYTVEIDAVILLSLGQQGYTPQSVPPAGTRILIKRHGNLDTDVTDRVHPEVAARAIEAAQVVGLDIAGLDIVAEDIGRPLEEQNGAVIEVNAGPGLQVHVQPTKGHPRPVGEAIIASMFAPGENGRIPIAAISGTRGKTSTARLLARMLTRGGDGVGVATSDGLYHNAERLRRGDFSGWEGAQSVLLNPNVDKAICEVSARSVLEEGLGFDSCDIALVTGVGELDRTGLPEWLTPEQIVQLIRAIVESVPENGFGVLKADDPLSAEMAEKCRGRVIYFAQNKLYPLLAEHRRGGGRVAFLEDGKLILAEGLKTWLECPFAPSGEAEQVARAIDDALAGAAAAWGLTAKPGQIQAELLASAGGAL